MELTSAGRYRAMAATGSCGNCACQGYIGFREGIAKLPDSDSRSRDDDFTEPKLSKNLELVERLQKVGKKYGRPPGQVAVAWVLHNPAVTAAIVGARNARQVEQNVGATELNFTDDDIAEIEGRKVREPKLVTQQLETNYEQLSQ